MMSDDYRLLTPENVELRYDIAGVGSRLVAAAVDYIAIVVGYYALLFAVSIVGPALALGARSIPADSRLSEMLGFAGLAAVVLLVFLGWWGYFILFELAWNGQSPGKRLLGLRVVRTGGQPISASASIARNLLRAIDLVFLIGVLVMLLDRSSRRLGDMAAGSLVIREPRRLTRVALAPVEIPSVPTTQVEGLPNAGRLTTAHYVLVRDYFARRRQLTPDRAEMVAAHLSADLARILEVAPLPVEDPVTFLATAARAFEARHPSYEAAR